MFDQILAATQLKKEIPYPVGYDVFGPISYPDIPVEIEKDISSSIVEKLDGLTHINLRIDNYSSKEQKNIRILFSGNYEYSPKFSFHRRAIDVEYEIHDKSKEIVLSRIPPNESVMVQFFNADQHFNIDQVLIGDSQITQFMQKLAEAKRYPQLFLAKFITLGSMLITIGAFGIFGYFTWSNNQASKTINIAMDGFVSCRPYIFDNTPDKEKLLERKFNQLGSWGNFVLSLNKVSSLDSLKLKDQVILCEPNSP